VKQYKLYIDYLNESINGVNRSLFKESNSHLTHSDIDSLKVYSTVCVKCLCELLDKLAHFNYTSEIMICIVNQLTSKIAAVSDLSLQSIKQMFRDDKELQLSSQITQKITKMMKQKSYGVRPEILNVFLSLRVKEINIIEDKKPQLTHKDKMKLSRQQRKVNIKKE
jgi:hypothetical protein